MSGVKVVGSGVGDWEADVGSIEPYDIVIFDVRDPIFENEKFSKNVTVHNFLGDRGNEYHIEVRYIQRKSKSSAGSTLGMKEL